MIQAIHLSVVNFAISYDQRHEVSDLPLVPMSLDGQSEARRSGGGRPRLRNNTWTAQAVGLILTVFCQSLVNFMSQPMSKRRPLFNPDFR
jgi:hypothetical protein